MDSGWIQKIFAAAAAELVTHERELSELDAQTGDGDHGFAIKRIAETIMQESKKPPRKSPQIYFDDLCVALLRLNGGSAGNLWGVMMEGIGETWPAAGRGTDLRTYVCSILRGALRGIAEISRAEPGEKTLVDPLYVALKTAEQETNSDDETYLQEVARAALMGADATAGMVAKYGRAKNLQRNSLGHRDPGAVSLAIMINAVCQTIVEEMGRG